MYWHDSTAYVPKCSMRSYNHRDSVISDENNFVLKCFREYISKGKFRVFDVLQHENPVKRKKPYSRPKFYEVLNREISLMIDYCYGTWVILLKGTDSFFQPTFRDASAHAILSQLSAHFTTFGQMFTCPSCIRT